MDSLKILPREAIVEMACVRGTASGSSEAVTREVSAAFDPGPGIWLDRNVYIRTGVGFEEFGRGTHAGFSGVCKRKAESSGWVTTESLGNFLRTSRFQYGFWAGSEATIPRNTQLPRLNTLPAEHPPLVAGVL